MQRDYKVAVVGLGLIGGSILKALRAKNIRLVAVSRSQETIDKAKKLNLADIYSTELEPVKDADVVFICAPIHKTIELIDKVREITDPTCIITDVASIKGFIMDHVNDYHFPTNFIGGHPMAGTEHKGIDHSFDTLFEGAKWAITPSRWSDTQDVEKLKELIRFMGATAIEANPYEHDKAVALISHMPLLISQALFGLINDYKDESVKNLALKLAASGFRDTTRLAATNPELAIDMLSINKINLKESISDYKEYLASLLDILNSDEDGFSRKVESIASNRASMYSKDGKNIYQ